MVDKENVDFENDAEINAENNAEEEIEKDEGDNLECYDFREARNKVYR